MGQKLKWKETEGVVYNIKSDTVNVEDSPICIDHGWSKAKKVMTSKRGEHSKGKLSSYMQWLPS